MSKFDVVIVAAGASARMGCDKLQLPLSSETVLGRAVSAFREHPKTAKIILVTRGEAADYSEYGAEIVKGGETRGLSVYNGLMRCTAPYVLIHDGARPFVSRELIDRVTESAERYGSAIPALPVSDSLRRARDGEIISAPERNDFYTVQTPQGFSLDKLKEAFLKANGESFTDESELFLKYIEPPKIVKGDERNTKITTLGDYFGINAKIGLGYDLHRLTAGDGIRLGGVMINCNLKTEAHSDGDALIHALSDAMFTALGERDIGCHYPDTDEKNKDMDSADILRAAAGIYNAKNIRINNISVTVITDSPKLSPYIPEMIKRLSEILGISESSIGISAKTTEKTNPNVLEVYAAVSAV